MWCVVLATLASARPLDTGAWNISNDYKYLLDKGLAAEVASIAKESGFSRIMDLGAGTGRYANEWRASGLQVAAYDGATNIETLSAGVVSRHDLTAPFERCEPGEVVTSLEVAEHIPRTRQDVYIANLVCSEPHLIVLSWARPGQPGNGHVNGRTPEYVETLMRTQGYGRDVAATRRLRAHASLPWFRSNIQVFVKKEKGRGDAT